LKILEMMNRHNPRPSNPAAAITVVASIARRLEKELPPTRMQRDQWCSFSENELSDALDQCSDSYRSGVRVARTVFWGILILTQCIVIGAAYYGLVLAPGSLPNPFVTAAAVAGWACSTSLLVSCAQSGLMTNGIVRFALGVFVLRDRCIAEPLLRPLSDTWNGCQGALDIASKSPAAELWKSSLVGGGRQLRVIDLNIMSQIGREEVEELREKQAEEAREVACKQLHGAL
jgi:hypothetical protein